MMRVKTFDNHNFLRLQNVITIICAPSQPNNDYAEYNIFIAKLKYIPWVWLVQLMIDTHFACTSHDFGVSICS